MSDPSKIKIIELESKLNSYLKKEQFQESLQCLIELLELNKQKFGEKSQEYQKTTDKLCQVTNIIGENYLKKENFDISIEFLKQSEIFSQKAESQRYTTYNNLANCYRKAQNPILAQKYYQSLLQEQLKCKKTNDIFDTYINLCGVLSNLGKHNEALQNILLAIISLQQKIMLDNGKDEKIGEKVVILCISYNNLGIEFEHLNRVLNQNYKFTKFKFIIKLLLNFSLKKLKMCIKNQY